MAYVRTAGTLSTRNFVPQIFSPTLLAIFDKYCCAMDCVNRDWEGDIAKAGDAVRIRQFGDIAWNTYTPDGAITYQLTSESGIDLLVDQLRYAAFRIDDVDQTQSDLQAMVGYAERMGVSGRELVDTFLITDMQTSTPVYNTMGGARPGAVIELTPNNVFAVLGELYTRLDEAKVFSRTTQNPWLLVPPKVMGVIRQSPHVTKATAKGDEVIRSGVVEMLAGFEIKSNHNMPYTPASSLVDGHWQILAGVNLGYGFAMQVNDFEDVRLIDTIGDGKRGLMVYGGEAVAPAALAKAFVKVS